MITAKKAGPSDAEPHTYHTERGFRVFIRSRFGVFSRALSEFDERLPTRTSENKHFRPLQYGCKDILSPSTTHAFSVA